MLSAHRYKVSISGNWPLTKYICFHSDIFIPWFNFFVSFSFVSFLIRFCYLRFSFLFFLPVTIARILFACELSSVLFSLSLFYLPIICLTTVTYKPIGTAKTQDSHTHIYEYIHSTHTLVCVSFLTKRERKNCVLFIIFVSFIAEITEIIRIHASQPE